MLNKVFKNAYFSHKHKVFWHRGNFSVKENKIKKINIYIKKKPYGFFLDLLAGLRPHDTETIAHPLSTRE